MRLGHLVGPGHLVSRPFLLTVTLNFVKTLAKTQCFCVFDVIFGLCFVFLCFAACVCALCFVFLAWRTTGENTGRGQVF